ncbi:hypothetical protein COO60DRAFT_1535584 [Scenedesmus sp. NREL 46B-D3]|nr:hypothetical protein COO60DRAFT_1535584 [Scenedesmus sp. NREL 46B-D3]
MSLCQVTVQLLIALYNTASVAMQLSAWQACWYSRFLQLWLRTPATVGWAFWVIHCYFYMDMQGQGGTACVFTCSC